MNKPYTIDNTFQSYNDGSGVTALITLRNGTVVRFSFSSACKTVVEPLENPKSSRNALGYGKERKVNEAAIGKATLDFNARVQALGPEWLAANKAMYS